MQLLEEYEALYLKLPAIYRLKDTVIWRFWDPKLHMLCTWSGKQVVFTIMLIAQRLIGWGVEERRRIRTGIANPPKGFQYPKMPRPPQHRLEALPVEQWRFVLGCIRHVALGAVS